MRGRKPLERERMTCGVLCHFPDEQELIVWKGPSCATLNLQYVSIVVWTAFSFLFSIFIFCFYFFKVTVTMDLWGWAPIGFHSLPSYAWLNVCVHCSVKFWEKMKCIFLYAYHPQGRKLHFESCMHHIIYIFFCHYGHNLPPKALQVLNGDVHWAVHDHVITPHFCWITLGSGDSKMNG